MSFKKHYTQRQKENTLATIRKWISLAKEANPDKFVDRKELSIQIQLHIGASKSKAEEYLDLLGVK